MATLSVLKFDTPDGAEHALATLRPAEAKPHRARGCSDGELASSAPEKAPKTKQLHSLTGAGALGGAFWGMLFGLIFFIPFFGLAVGAAIGALAGISPTTASTTSSSRRRARRSPKAPPRCSC